MTGDIRLKYAVWPGMPEQGGGNFSWGCPYDEATPISQASNGGTILFPAPFFPGLAFDLGIAVQGEHLFFYAQFSRTFTAHAKIICSQPPVDDPQFTLLALLRKEIDVINNFQIGRAVHSGHNRSMVFFKMTDQDLFNADKHNYFRIEFDDVWLGYIRSPQLDIIDASFHQNDMRMFKTSHAITATEYCHRAHEKKNTGKKFHCLWFSMLGLVDIAGAAGSLRRYDLHFAGLFFVASSHPSSHPFLATVFINILVITGFYQAIISKCQYLPQISFQP
ncbi:hypothetical protein [Undibacterium pigrum]|uniref:hypothetical protein n=1 Tax=Undibacterium pigrum TaxID=401470 RepID=UPI0011B6AA01|nr:hypothetical protein [Undibacterium pigrum]